MIKKFNYTGRQKILRSKVRITLIEKDRKRSFDAHVDFDEMDLPPDAAIYIEPYYHFSFMRFNCGTIHKFFVPADTSITDIPYSDILFFRIKVVDEKGKHGRLIAYADELKPEVLDKGRVNRKSILPVDFSSDLGQQIWKLSFNGQGPVLQINKRIENRKDLVMSDEFIAIAFPAIVKEVITKIACNYPDFEEEEDHWVSRWLQFTKRILYVHDKPQPSEDKEKDKEDWEEWIESVIEAFCRKNSVRNRYESSNMAK